MYVCIYVYIYIHIYIYTYICTHTYVHINIYICTYIYIHLYLYDVSKYIRICLHTYTYGVATISRLLRIMGLFCRIQSLLQGSFAKETYNFKEPTNRSHPIFMYMSHAHVHVLESRTRVSVPFHN